MIRLESFCQCPPLTLIHAECWGPFVFYQGGLAATIKGKLERFPIIKPCYLAEKKYSGWEATRLAIASATAMAAAGFEHHGMYPLIDGRIMRVFPTTPQQNGEQISTPYTVQYTYPDGTKGRRLPLKIRHKR
jgi:hypothetical protein